MFAPDPADGPLAIVVFLLIHVAVPAAGFVAFRRTARRMAVAGLSGAPVVRLFVLCATYGGWLLVGLTGLFWYWSAAASLGAAYLLLVAPVATLAIAVKTFRERAASGYQRLIFWAAAVYPPAMLAVVALAQQFA